jgi:hypothetical protein
MGVLVCVDDVRLAATLRRWAVLYRERRINDVTGTQPEAHDRELSVIKPREAITLPSADQRRQCHLSKREFT